MPNTPSGGTLTLAFPAHCEDAQSAIEKWLMGLWQVSSKYNWSLFRSRSTASLEYLALAGQVSCRVHLSSKLLAALTRSLLVAHLPGIELQPDDADPRKTFAAANSQLIVNFAMRNPGWIELPKPTDPDAVLGILSALRCEADETALIQILLTPTWMKTEDGAQPAFWLSGRLLAGSKNDYLTRTKLSLLAGAFGQFAGFNGLRFERARRLRSGDLESVAARRWPRRILPPGLPVTPAQVALLFHPPAEPAATPGLNAIASRRTPSLSFAGKITLGTGLDNHGRSVPVNLEPQDLLRHALIIGPSGSGKTTFLANLARELAEAGHGVTVLDPHGSLVRTIARQLPADRVADAYMFKFSDFDYPIPINPLRARAGHEFLAADELVEILQRVQGREYWGPLLDLLLRHAAMASIELGGSLIEAARLLEDPWFRQSALERLDNRQTVRFLGQLADGAMFDRRVLPAINRLHRFLATPWLRNILGQSVEGIDFAELMEKKRIALFDLSGIGANNARLLGSVLLMLMRQATLQRRDDGSDPMHFVLVDEASWFLSRTVAELLDQARKFGVGLVLAVQRVGQLAPEDVREAVLANTGSALSFRISDREEAGFMARHFGSPLIELSDVQQLPRFQAYWQVTHDGDRLPPAWLTLAQPIKSEDPALEARALLAARDRYARPRAVVEAEIESRERVLLDDQANEEPEVRSIPLPSPLAVLADTPR